MLRLLTAVVGASVAAEAHSLINRRDHDTDASNLAVSLAASPSGRSTEIEATIANVGNAAVNLLKLGTILDSRPVKKLTIVDEKGKSTPLDFCLVFLS